MDFALVYLMGISGSKRADDFFLQNTYLHRGFTLFFESSPFFLLFKVGFCSIQSVSKQSKMWAIIVSDDFFPIIGTPMYIIYVEIVRKKTI